jgi:2,4-dienoyl-CoA reductase-like NADH-dependent reductase (Old Yellow Enzyme family)
MPVVRVITGFVHLGYRACAMSTLHTPLTFRSGLTIANRTVLAPMTNLQSHADGTLADAELQWLRRRATGGFGLVETCAAYVCDDGKSWPGELGVHSDAMLPGLTRLAAELKAAGAPALVQIFHGGARAAEDLAGRPWSASENEADPAKPRAATEEDIHRTIRAFADAALRAKNAGFAGVEIHGAHGYLPCQFLSRVQNTRTDGYGGSYDGRARFLREITRAVRAAVGADCTVGVRVSLEDFGQSVGMDLDEGLTLAQELVQDGAEFIHASLWDCARMTTKRPDSHAITLLRAALPADVRILVAGKIWSRADADKALALGADAVAIGRAAIAYPEWPRLAKAEDYAPAAPPFSAEQLRAADLSETFVSYMKRWKGFVA